MKPKSVRYLGRVFRDDGSAIEHQCTDLFLAVEFCEQFAEPTDRGWIVLDLEQPVGRGHLIVAGHL